MSGKPIELVWRGGAYAVVWKVVGVPLDDTSSGADEPATGSGKQRCGRAPPQSVLAWARRELEGQWRCSTALSLAAAGLVLLARAVAGPAPTAVQPVRGTYALLAVPRALPPASALLAGPAAAAEARLMWQSLGLFGDILDSARVAEEWPSGHFGRIALVEADVCLIGAQAMSPLQVIMELQELGFLAVRLNGLRTSELHNPESPEQSSSQVDVMQGTCISIVAVAPPGDSALRSTARFNSVHRKSGRVTHAPPRKFEKLIAVEKALAEQRRQPSDGIVMFRGVQLLVPEAQLRPRASSGALVDAALAALGSSRAGVRVLDLGVGCGALLLALLRALDESSSGTGVDIDEAAVRTCQENISRVLAPHQAANVGAVLADFGQLDAPAVRPQLAARGYHVVMCNPPYRSEEQQASYNQTSGQLGGYSEHSKTLVAGETGLEMYEAVARCLARDAEEASQRGAAGQTALGPLLRAGGTLIFQVEAGSRGHVGGQAARVAAAVERASEGALRLRSVHTDERGLERAILLEHSAHLATQAAR